MKKHFLALGLLAFSGMASGADFNVRWEFDNGPTSTCSDGTLASAGCPLVGFEVYSSNSLDGTYSYLESIGPALRNKVYTNIAAGTTRCYMLKAYTGSAPNWVKSGDSNKACGTANFVPPKAPGGMNVQVTLTVSFAPVPAPTP